MILLLLLLLFKDLNKPTVGVFTPFGVSTGFGESYVFAAVIGNIIDYY